MSYWQSLYADPEKLKGANLRALGRAWQFVRQDRRQLGAYVSLTLLSTLLAVIPPLVYRSIINDAILHPDLPLLLRLVLLLLALQVAQTAAVVGAGWLSNIVGWNIIVRIRSVLYDHLQRMPLAFFTRAQTGKVQSRIGQDVNQAQNLFTGTLSSVFTDLLTVLVTLAFMVSFSWQVTLVTLALAPLLIGTGELISRRTRTIYRDYLKKWSDMQAMTAERLNTAGALLVKLFGNPKAELAEFDRRTATMRHQGIRLSVLQIAFGASMSLAAGVAIVAVYGIGGAAVLHHAMSVGSLVALAAYVQRLYVPIIDLASTRVNMAQQLVSFDRVFEVLDLPRAISDRPGAPELAVGDAAVTFEGVSFRYPAPATVSLKSLEADDAAELSREPSDWILRDINLMLPGGRMSAIVGPSGAGKTTLSHLVPRLYDVTEGCIRIDGQDIREVGLDSLARSIAVVPQDPFLFHETIAANLRLARPGATDEELHAVCTAARLADLIERLPERYETIVGERGYRFSGGEKQRIAIARVLLKDPQIVILDEATSHLDSETEALVQEALAAALRGRTSLVIAHRLSTILESDQIVVLDAGRVVDVGTHVELVRKSGVYAHLYQTQFRSESAASTFAPRDPLTAGG
ncbi:MAG: ABC transporter ATP-binding protein [Candidatus Dormibacteria bacterium]